MNLQALLDGYAAIYGMPEIPLDANDMCRLTFRGTVHVDLEPSRRPDHVHLYTVLARVAATADAAFFRRALEANLFGRDTGMASIGVNPETDELMLTALVDIDALTPERFDLLLQDFVEAAATLRDSLVQDASAAVAHEERDDPSVFMRTIQMRV